MYPRAKTLGILLDNNRILAEEFHGRHSTGVGTYYRPIGGSIEFGEKSAEALVREYDEELNVGIIIEQYIGCLENIFSIDEEMGHEIIQLYLVGFRDSANYEKELFEVIEGNKRAVAKWLLMDDVISNRKVIYPSGLIERLEQMKG
jgi:8-oxo-dGTP pyrophosphatase MutT (NUDIX family)